MGPRKGTPVGELRTAQELHGAAVQMWRQLSDEDAVRSARYEDADGRRSAGFPPISSEGRRRAANWVNTLHRYEAFWRVNAHAPRENTRNRAMLPAGERRLAEWARYQRQFQDTLCLYQRVRLDLSPAFAWDPQQAAWQANWTRCARHLAATGGLPRLNADDPVEFVLARWLGRQLGQYQNGTLPTTRRVLLVRLLELARHK